MTAPSYHTSSGLGIGRVAHLIDLAPTILSREEREENLAAIDQSPWCESTHAPVDWDSDDRMFALAEREGSRSTCPGGFIGAAARLINGSIISGHNGAPTGVAPCLEAGCVVIPATKTAREYSRHVHAEAAVIAKAARDGHRISGASLWVTTPCCLDCSRLLCMAGVKEVVIRTAPEAWTCSVGQFLNQGGVAVRTVE